MTNIPQNYKEDIRTILFGADQTRLLYPEDDDVESGQPTGDFGWSTDPGMFHAPLREHLYAALPTSVYFSEDKND